MGVGQKNVNVEPKKEQNHITCLRSAEQKSAPTEKKKIGHSTSGNRTRGVCVTGRNVTNYTNADLLLEIRQKHCLCCCSLIRAWSAYNSKPQASSFGHTTVDIPHLVRTAKSSTLGPNQYCGGGPRGNLRCRMFFCFLSQISNMPVVILGLPFLYPCLALFSGQNRVQRCCGKKALRQCTDPLPGSMALQTENTVGLPLARKERITGEIVINVLIFLCFHKIKKKYMPVVILGPGFRLFSVFWNLHRFFGIFLGQIRAQRCCGKNALRQCTAPFPGSMALQTENNHGVPVARKEKITVAQSGLTS